MAAMHPLETYLRELRDIRASGAGVPETSYYAPLANLLNEIGKGLKPKIRCIINLANRGAGIPDGGLFTPDQLRKIDGNGDNPLLNLPPSRGVMEVKPTAANLDALAKSDQVTRYCNKYGLVLVTNLREFQLVTRNGTGQPTPLEAYALAGSEGEFWSQASQPRKLTDLHGERFVGYLQRAMLHNAQLTDPKDLAFFLASYAREALSRIKGSDLPALHTLRTALEEALSMKFRGAAGEHFFESTLIQTLFYGVFSAWVLWSRKQKPTDKTATFDWMHSASYLNVPVLRKLFYEAADPGQLDALNISEVLNWASAVLNRVDRAAFFEAFDQHHAVQYFYEPFLEAYDPELRKELGVWYTPPEVVTYMVKRVDRVLREELAVPDGLADPRVVVLDPCCGTGAFLVEVLNQIHATLAEKGGDALVASDLKKAIQERVFGFEILPAPYVVSHLQLGLRLTDLGVPLSAKQRVGVFLTNALTGWEPPDPTKKRLPITIHELEEERDAAEHVKQSSPILVILGNPPYNGFADVALEEERDLSLAYRETKKAPKPQGQGLNDLYVRFFRMAERRIVDKSGKGIVCYISNYSWLDGLSHTGMRERYLEAFDKIWIDCLNGDKYKTGKLTPDGKPDPSIFSTEFNREGIQVGTAIATMVRKEKHQDTQAVHFRHLWGKDKRAELATNGDDDGRQSYKDLAPSCGLGYSFMPGVVSEAYLTWPQLPDLMPVSFPGIQAGRDDVVVSIDKQMLVERMQLYFNPKIANDEITRLVPGVMDPSARFDPVEVRSVLVKRGFLPENIVPCLYRPLDSRWLYWEPDTKLLDEKRAEYVAHLAPDNIWLATAQRHRKVWDPPLISRQHACRHINERGANLFPLMLQPSAKQAKLFEPSSQPQPNLSAAAVNYLTDLGLANDRHGVEYLFFHAFAIMHSPAYKAENAGALCQDWPRIPLPATREALEASATLGRKVAALLDVTQPVDGVTCGKICPELKAIGLITRTDGKSIDPDSGDLKITAGWGNPGRAGITMPATGKAILRVHTPDEKDTPRDLGEQTYDIYLNENVYWRNVPEAAWNYTLGGYQVIKKWLSYREHKLLGRHLHVDEARYVMEMSRRISSLILLVPQLDSCYMEVLQCQAR